jgi:GT2 family glycosyltransferase
MHPRISTIIPAHNAEDTLRECLTALLADDYPDHEVIVVDDVSSDSTAAICSEYPVRVIRLEANAGPAAARNRGAREATGEILFFIDSDVKVSANALETITEVFEDTSVDAVTGLFSDQQRFRNFPSEYKNMWMHHTYKRLAGEVSLFYTSGAAVRRDVFMDAGCFDENYRTPSVEDTDFGHRLRKRGHNVYVAKKLAVEHMKRYSTASVLRTDFLRSSALTRLFLRRGLIWNGHRNSTSVPGSFAVSVILLFASILLLIAGGVFGRYELLAAAGVLYVCFIAAHHEFLRSLGARGGWPYLLQGLGLVTVDTIAAGLGIMVGLVGYVMGERY